jgi:hexulose-6-phosphate isomerase
MNMPMPVSSCSRRSFLLASSLCAAGLATLSPALLAQETSRRALKKGIMWGTIGVKGSTLEKMQAVKAAGFHGVEMMSHMNVDEVLAARDQTGLEIPSVCGTHHWAKPLTHPDEKVRAEGQAALQQSLREAAKYGAKSVLLVPGIVNKEVSYAEAWDRSIAEIKKALPLARELKVRIAIENVWNSFLLSPLEAVRYVDQFHDPMVGWHFDAGNIVNYGWPEQWIETLGPRMVMLHIKEFDKKKRDKEGLWKGFDAKLTEGDVSWPAVMQAVDRVRYTGWAITEQGGGDSPEGLADLSARLGKIIAS